VVGAKDKSSVILIFDRRIPPAAFNDSPLEPCFACTSRLVVVPDLFGRVVMLLIKLSIVGLLA
jgi:hypothetical protein